MLLTLRYAERPSLVEALSFRGPLPCPVADHQRWLLSGLADAFDRQP